MGYRGYGLPIGEVISEGNVGLMQAVKRFDPDKGFRLATYAMWWIRASIQEYILRSWSLVKMGTTAAQKKLFFNLRKVKGQLKALEEGDFRPDQVKRIATQLGVTEEDVDVDEPAAGRRLIAQRPGAERCRERRVAGLAGRRDLDQETALAESRGAREPPRHAERRAQGLKHASVACSRRAGWPKTRSPSRSCRPSSASSRERIRQIEVRAFEKVQKAVTKAASAASQREPAPAE